MGRSPCCDKVGLKKGPWTPEEDQKLLAYIEEHGHGNWRALPSKAGLQRCGKSCRLRWTNYLRPDIKRGKFSLQEEQTIIQLHALLGNRWSAIATHLPKRTDNEIKNYWNTHLKKRLTKMGIDPVTHKPKNEALLSGGGGGDDDGAQSKTAANLSHMAQWESARLEAEARLARQSKLRSNSFHISQLGLPPADFLHQSSCSSLNNLSHSTSPPPPPPPPPTTARCLDVLKACPYNGPGWQPKTMEGTSGAHHSPTSTLSFSESGPAAIGGPPVLGERGGESSAAMIEFMGNNNSNNSGSYDEMVKEDGSTAEEGDQWKAGFGNNNSNHLAHQHLDNHHDQDYNDGMENSMSFTSGLHHHDQMTLSIDNRRGDNHGEDDDNANHDDSVGNFIDGFTELLLSNFMERNLSSDGGNPETDNASGSSVGGVGGGTSDEGSGGSGACGGGGGGGYEDNKSYWNSILNLVNSSPSSSPLF